jgi:hypothetical protein
MCSPFRLTTAPSHCHTNTKRKSKSRQNCFARGEPKCLTSNIDRTGVSNIQPTWCWNSSLTHVKCETSSSAGRPSGTDGHSSARATAVCGPTVAGAYAVTAWGSLCHTTDSTHIIAHGGPVLQFLPVGLARWERFEFHAPPPLPLQRVYALARSKPPIPTVQRCRFLQTNEQPGDHRT